MTPAPRTIVMLAGVGTALLACQSSVPSGEPLISPNQVTATIDGRTWTSATVTPSYRLTGAVFTLIAQNPADSFATQLKIVLIKVPYGPGTYAVIDTTGSLEVTPPHSYSWGTATADDGCDEDCRITYPVFGHVVFSRLDADRAIGSFTIDPPPHSTSGTFDIELH